MLFAWLFVAWCFIFACGVFGLAEWGRLDGWGRVLTVVSWVLVICVGVVGTGVLL